MSFITGKNGVPITELYAKDIRSGLRLHWHDWIISGKPVPASWMQVGAVAMGKYYDFAAETYPPVGLCANNWKAHKIGLTYYPAWIQANAAKIKTAAEKSRQSEIEQGALALQISSGGTALDLKRPRRTDESASTRKRVKKEVKEENSKSTQSLVADNAPLVPPMPDASEVPTPKDCEVPTAATPSPDLASAPAIAETLPVPTLAMQVAASTPTLVMTPTLPTTPTTTTPMIPIPTNPTTSAPTTPTPTTPTVTTPTPTTPLPAVPVTISMPTTPVMNQSSTIQEPTPMPTLSPIVPATPIPVAAPMSVAQDFEVTPPTAPLEDNVQIPNHQEATQPLPLAPFMQDKGFDEPGSDTIVIEPTPLTENSRTTFDLPHEEMDDPLTNKYAKFSQFRSKNPLLNDKSYVNSAPLDLTLPSSSSQADSGENPEKKKKAVAGKMTATKSTTPRNLCAIQWISKVKGTREQFATYWSSLSAEEIKTWTEKSNQAKAAGKEAATGKEATMAAAS